MGNRPRRCCPDDTFLVGREGGPLNGLIYMCWILRVLSSHVPCTLSTLHTHAPPTLRTHHRRTGTLTLFTSFRRTTRGEVSAEPGKKHSLVRTLETRAISNGLAAPVATSEAPYLAGARMGRAATDRAAIAGENPAGARVWEGGVDGCADDYYHHCLGEGDGTRRPAQERQAGRAEGCRAGGAGTRADGRVWEVGTDTARAQARASRPLRRRRKRERQRGLACGRECGPRNAGRMRATQCGSRLRFSSVGWGGVG